MLLRVNIKTGEVLVNRVLEYSMRQRVLVGEEGEAYSRELAEKFRKEWDKAHRLYLEYEEKERRRKLEEAKRSLAPEIERLRVRLENPHPNPVTQKRIVGRMRGMLKKKLAARCGRFVSEMPDEQLLSVLLD